MTSRSSMPVRTEPRGPRRRSLTAMAPLLALLVTSGQALAETPTGATSHAACDKAIGPSESDLAHQKYIAGKQDYDEGNYESAVRRFRDAYTLDCTKHELLIIISLAYERKGDRQEAVNALETYVARAPTAPDVGTYKAKIENLKKQIAAEPPPAPKAPPVAAASSTVVPRGHTPWPWVVTVAGVVAVGIGVAVVATAPSLPERCDEETEKCTRFEGETDGDFADRQDTAGRATHQPTWGAVTIVGGGLLVAGGLLWHFLEPTEPTERAKAKLRPQLSPNFAGVSVVGTF